MKYLKDCWTARKKIVVYVNTLNKCFQIYLWICATLMDGVFVNRESSPENRRVEMFHANTDEETKDRILNDMRSSNGSIEILICTVAFGMGIDVGNIEMVIHWGVPKSSLHYWQEVGRCARDQRPGYALCYCFPRSVTLSSDTMKAFSSDAKCARVTILKDFQLLGMSDEELKRLKQPTLCNKNCRICCACQMCKCCSFCQTRCTCPYKSTDTFGNLMNNSGIENQANSLT